MQKRTQTFLIVMLAGTFLAACSSQKKSIVQAKMPQTAGMTKETMWQQRQTSMQKTSNWNMKGRVGLVHNQESWSFGITWMQQGEGYNMDIKNPLTGGTVALLKTTREGVSLKTSKGKVFHDKDAEKLLKRQVGVHMPIKGLKYWVRGLPSPTHGKFTVSLDRQGRPKILRQSGWNVTYISYRGRKFNALPAKVILKRPPKTRVKVLAKQWKIQ